LIVVADLDLTYVQEHPKLVEDVDLSSTSLIASKRFGTIQGNICHIKLAMILEQVLSQMYSIKPKNLETRIEAAEKLEKDLADWYESSSNLEPSIGDPTSKLGLLLVIVHVHAQILLYPWRIPSPGSNSQGGSLPPISYRNDYSHLRNVKERHVF
jgi:hypothetical protein